MNLIPSEHQPELGYRVHVCEYGFLHVLGRVVGTPQLKVKPNNVTLDIGIVQAATMHYTVGIKAENKSTTAADINKILNKKHFPKIHLSYIVYCPLYVSHQCWEFCKVCSYRNALFYVSYSIRVFELIPFSLVLT